MLSVLAGLSGFTQPPSSLDAIPELASKDGLATAGPLVPSPPGEMSRPSVPRQRNRRREGYRRGQKRAAPETSIDMAASCVTAVSVI
jgi:hypothetical protein